MAWHEEAWHGMVGDWAWTMGTGPGLWASTPEDEDEDHQFRIKSAGLYTALLDGIELCLIEADLRFHPSMKSMKK